MEARGLKPFQLNKVKRWCKTAGVTEVLVSSSTVPPPALTSCVALPVGDGVHNEEDVTESDRDDSISNDSGERDSNEDCVVIGGKETAMTHDEVDNTSGKRAATGTTHHVTRRVLQSIKFTLSRFAVNGIACRVHTLQ